MSAESKNTADPDHGVGEPSAALMTFWVQWMEQASRGTQAILEAVQTVSDPAQLQRRWSDVMSEAAEDFMRTPAFMEAMRRNLKNLTDAKRMQDNFVQDTARHLGIPLADDITGLFERLNSTERKILTRLQAIEDRLAAIEANGSKGTRRPASSSGQHGETHQS